MLEVLLLILKCFVDTISMPSINHIHVLSFIRKKVVIYDISERLTR